ncbi:MAG: EthD domain-containing protein [Flavobacterium sp.]
MLKFTFLINKVPHMSIKEFVDYHKNHHARLFTSIPETEKYVRKYVVSHPVEVEGFPKPIYDGITDIYFDSMKDFNSFFSSANYLEKVNPDESNFITLNTVVALVSHETGVIG